MSQELTKARSKLSGVHSLLKQDNISEAQDQLSRMEERKQELLQQLRQQLQEHNLEQAEQLKQKLLKAPQMQAFARKVLQKQQQ